MKLTTTGDLYADGSILGVDQNSNGVFEKEVELLEFAKKNHFTHLIIYDLKNVFGQSAPLIWNQRALENQTLEEHLCRFMTDAQDYCVKSFGAIGGVNSLNNAANFDGNVSTPGPSLPIALTPIEGTLFPRLRIVEDTTLVPGTSIFNEAEFYKSFLRLSRFNSTNICGVHFDFLCYENEFWNTIPGNEDPFDVCYPSLGGPLTGCDVGVDTNCLPPSGISTCCNTSYFADDPYQTANNVVRCSTPYFSRKTAEFYQKVLPQLELLNGLQQNNSTPLKIELYLSSLYVNEIDNPERIISSIDSWYHRDTTDQLVDRILLTHYRNYAAPLNPAMHNGFYNNNYNNLAEGGVPHTDIHTLVNAESIQHNGYADYMGPYLDATPSHTIFTYEKENYEDWRANVAGANFNSNKENNVQPGGFAHYTSNMYLPYYSSPALFYPEGFPACATNGTYVVDWSKFQYIGPTENGINFIFKITDLSGGVQFYSVSGTSTDYSGFVSPSLYFSTIDFKNSSIFTVLSLPVGNYKATLNLHYENGGGCTYEYESRIDVVNGPAITALTADNPISFCEGNYVWLQANEAGSSPSTQFDWMYSIDNTVFTSIAPPETLRILKAEKSGFYKCNITNPSCGSDGVSNTIEITVNPNPPIHIYSTCVTNQQIHEIELSTTPPGIPAHSAGSLIYRWSTGETTATITVPYGHVTVYVYVYSPYSPDCKQYGKIVIPFAYDADDIYYIGNSPTIIPLGDDNNPCTENTSITVQLYHQYRDDNGNLLNVPVNSTVYYSWSDGTYGKTLSYPVYGVSYSVSATQGLSAGCFSGNYIYSPTTTPPIPTITPNITKTNVGCTTLGGFVIDLSSTTGTYQFSYSGIPASQVVIINSNLMTVTGLLAGNYTIEIHEINSAICAGIFTTTITIDPPSNPPVITNIVVNNASTSCSGGTGGSASVFAVGTAPLSYNWTNGSNTSSISGLSGGSYTVTVTDANGCTVSDIVHVQGYNSMTVNASIVTQSSCNGGSNGSATVSVVGGVFPFAYSWDSSPVQVAHTATGLAPGTYACTVTDNNGCSVLSSPVIINNSSSINVAISKNDVSCSGGTNGSATANVTGALNPSLYQWSPSGGTNLLATGLNAGNYVFTITDANSCTGSVSVAILEPDPLLVSFINRYDNICISGSSGEVTANVIGGTQAYSYLWNPGAFTTQTNSSLTNGTYSLTVTDNNACTAQSSVVISTVPNSTCCGQGSANFPHYPDSTNTTNAITYNVNLGAQFSVEFNASMTLTGNTFFIQEGLTWIVKNGVTLTLTNCTLQTCGNMWKGIIVQDGGALVLNGTIIKDAEFAVNMLANGTLFSSGSSFVNNYIGIYYAPWVSHSGSLSIHGTQFKGLGQMKPGYHNQQNSVGSKPLAGISLADFSGALNSNSSPNTFDNMNAGIIIQNCNLQIKNASFSNIFPDLSIARSSLDGCGIYYADWQGGTLEMEGFGQFSASLNFDQCKIGIRVAEGGANVVNCTFGSALNPIETAIECNYSAPSEIHIRENYIEATNFGVNLRMVNGSNAIEVRGNVINIGANSLPRSIGIRVLNGSGYLANGNIPYPAYNISNNIVNLVRACRSGISMESANSFNVEHNDINLNTIQSNLYGIYMENSDACEISCNEITGILNGGGLSSLSGQAAVRVKRSRLNSFGCNDIKNTRDGFRFDEPCNDTKLFGNTLGRHNTGLHLGLSGVIGPQPANLNSRLPGNIWTESCLSCDALCENLIYYKYWYNNLGPYTQFTAVTVNPTNWFGPDLLRNNFECGPISLSGPVSIAGYCSSPAYLQEWGMNEADLDIIRDSLQFQEFNEELLWEMKKDLFEKFNLEPDMLENDQAFMDFYNNYLVTPIGGFLEVQELTSEYFNFDSATSAIIKQEQELIGIHLDDIQSLNEQMPAADELQRITLETSVKTLQNDIDLLETSINTLLDQYHNHALIVLNSALSENSIVQTSSLIEENTQRVNEDYLSLFTNSGLSQSGPPPPGEYEVAETPAIDPSILTELSNIAEQCPLSGGKAVYRARALYSMVDPDKTYDDEIICLNQGILYRHGKEDEVITSFSLFPNPANESILLLYTLEVEQKAHLIIRNSVGQGVYFTDVSSKQRKLEINIRNLANGVYTVQFLSKNSLLYQEKMVIIR